MKRIYVLGVLTLILSACLKDKSNYDTRPHEDIVVEGIEPTYTKISTVDRITLNPTVSSSDENAEFEYMWGIYETNVQGYAPVLDTLAKTKELDVLIDQPAKNWVLVFRVTNKNTGYSTYVNSTIQVVTQYTRGWYVAKGQGDSADVDLFLTPESIQPDGLVPNAFSAINGKKLAGKPLIMNFYNDYKSMVTGSIGNTRSLFVVSDKDASAIDINTFKEIRGLDELFYSVPDLKAPGFVTNGSSALYIQNDGGLHSIYTMSANSGLFGVRKMKDNKNTPYQLSKYFFSETSYFFDDLSSSFLSASGSGSTMTEITDADDTEMPANNNNKRMLYMGYKSREYVPSEYKYIYVGYALFQDKTDASLKILSKLVPDRYSLQIENDTLQTTDKLYQASHYALLDADENLMYFSVGNQVWSRNLSNQNEKLQFTTPAGEEVTFIRHRKYTESGYAFNYVMVGTQIGDRYKVRMFEKTSGNLNAEPAFVLEGTGTVGDVIYIAPGVSGYTYVNTY